MPRIPLITERDGLTGARAETFDWVVESRGSMIRPYEVLLHRPEIARPAAELGHQIRYEGVLSDHDRELAILTAAVEYDCAFEWQSHEPIAERAGVRAEARAALQGDAGELNPGEEAVVSFVRELAEAGDVTDATHAAAVERLGVEGVVELAVLTGYYAMLAYAMNVAGAC